MSESIIANNPLAKVAAYRKPKTIPTTYSESDVIAILKAVKNNLRNQAIVYTFLDSGVRLKGGEAPVLEPLVTSPPSGGGSIEGCRSGRGAGVAVEGRSERGDEDLREG